MRNETSPAMNADAAGAADARPRPRAGQAPGSEKASNAAVLLNAYLASRKRLAAQTPGGTGGTAVSTVSAASANVHRGPVVLVFRQRYRVALSEHTDGQILISARIVTLPGAGPRRDALLSHMGRLGLVVATRYGAACVIDANEHAAWLEDRQPPDGKVVDLAVRVRRFVNALATWQKTLDRTHF